MFSALKSIAAGVIAALIGGFLLAGVVNPQQGDGVVPAAVTESPSPTTTEELLTGMVTEEIEPGIYRVVNDGVRDLEVLDAGSPNSWLSIDPDGGIWVFGEEVAYRLGEALTYDWDHIAPWTYEVAPDGTLWGDAFGSGMSTFDGQSWTERGVLDARTHVSAFAIGLDGTVWVTAQDNGGCPDDASTPSCRRTVLVRVDETGTSTARGWEGVYTGHLSGHKPVVGPDGDIWLVGRGEEPFSYSVEAFLRYDRSGWHVIDVPEGLSTADVGSESFGFAPDGTGQRSCPLTWTCTTETTALRASTSPVGPSSQRPTASALGAQAASRALGKRCRKASAITQSSLLKRPSAPRNTSSR